jgi:hypothetical protein
MKKLSIVLGLAAALYAAEANASVTINFSGTTAIPSNNDFNTQLNGLGLTRYATTGASLVLDANSIITFQLLGSESGFNDTYSTISAPNLSYTEYTTFLNDFSTPISIGSAAFNAGSLAGLLNFSSNGGRSVTVGQDGFGIFLGRGQTSGQSVSTFYIGYDDQASNQDNDYDDMIIRATVRSAVPEPATWAMMLIGFGAIGLTLRRKPRPAHVMAQAA